MTPADVTDRGSATGPLGAVDRWLFEPCPAERLAAVRILVGGFAVIYLIAASAEFARTTRQPSSRFEQRGVVGLLDQPLGPTAFWWLYLVTILVGAAFAAGALWRVTGPVFAAAVLFWASYHSSWGQLLHFEHVVSLHLLVLAFSPAADVWSVDARRRAARGRPSTARDRSTYGWTLRLMAIITVTTYTIAGLAKLRISGLQWVDGTTLTHHIAYSATRLDLLGATPPPLAAWVVGHGWLLTPLAIAALLVELGAPAALVGRRPRLIWAFGALALHLGIALSMGVFFAYQALGFAMLPLFAPERLFSRAGRCLNLDG